MSLLADPKCVGWLGVPTSADGWTGAEPEKNCGNGDSLNGVDGCES